MNNIDTDIMVENNKEIKKLQEENEKLKNFFRPFVKKFREAALHEYWWCPFCNKEVIITYDGKCPECEMNMEDVYPSIDWINEATDLIEKGAPKINGNARLLNNI